MSETQLPQPLEFPLVWVGVDDQPVVMVNQFLGQVEPGVALVTLGQATPPLLIGTPEEIRQQAERVAFVQVRTVVRLAITRLRLQEMIQVLQGTLDNLESIPSGDA